MQISEKLVQRLLLERDLVDSRDIVYETPDGLTIVFTIRTLSAEEKTGIKKKFDMSFPVPPTKSFERGLARFDIMDPGYQKRLEVWSQGLSRGVLAETIGVSVPDIEYIERLFPVEFVNHLFSSIELINGIQSDPLAELIREAMWAPEVLTFLEKHQTPAGGLTISETPLFREIDCLVAAGLSLREWECLSPREKMTYVNWYDYKVAKEAYIADYHDPKKKTIRR